MFLNVLDRVTTDVAKNLQRWQSSQVNSSQWCWQTQAQMSLYFLIFL